MRAAEEKTDLTAVEEKIWRLMDKELRGRLDEALRDLKDAIIQLEDPERRREGLRLILRLRDLLLGQSLESRGGD